MAILMRLAALAVTVAIFTACDFTREAPLVVEGEQIAVYSVLEAGSDSVSVFIVRAPIDTDPGEAPFFPVSGAEVRITTPAGETLRLGETPEFTPCFIPSRVIVEQLSVSGCYRAAAPGGVRPGGRYSLLVRLPGGGEVRGEAVVPENPEILAPEPGARIPVVPGFDPGGFVVRFDAPPAAARLQLLIHSLRANCDVRLELQAEFVGGVRVIENTITIIDAERNRVRVELKRATCEAEPGEFVRFDSLPVGLTLVAYDSAFARYARRLLDPEGAVRTKPLSAGLEEGASGLFAGASSARQRIVLVPLE